MYIVVFLAFKDRYERIMTSNKAYIPVPRLPLLLQFHLHLNNAILNVCPDVLRLLVMRQLDFIGLVYINVFLNILYK